MNSLRTAVLALCVASVSCSDQSTQPVDAARRNTSQPVAFKGDVAVRSELFAADALPHNIQSDGLGAYVNGTNGLVSILQAIGDWELDLTPRRNTRGARIDFGEPLPGNPGAAPFTSEVVKARFIAKSTQMNPGISKMTGLGSTILSPISVAFAYGNSNYAIRMNATNHPGSDWALVTCTGVSDPSNPATSPCNKWRLTPNGSYDGVTKNVGYVERVASPSTFIGWFYFAFDIQLTK